VLRSDPALKPACGRLPDSGRDLCSQPTLSRLENALGLKDAIRLTYALIDQWMASYLRIPTVQCVCMELSLAAFRHAPRAPPSMPATVRVLQGPPGKACLPPSAEIQTDPRPPGE